MTKTEGYLTERRVAGKDGGMSRGGQIYRDIERHTDMDIYINTDAQGPKADGECEIGKYANRTHNGLVSTGSIDPAYFG